MRFGLTRNQVVRSFFWGHEVGTRKLHLMNWNHLHQPRDNGGLGTRQFDCFNQALLGKLAWRLLRDRLPSSPKPSEGYSGWERGDYTVRFAYWHLVKEREPTNLDPLRQEEESYMHLFLLCPFSKPVWFGSALTVRPDSFGYTSITSWLEAWINKRDICSREGFWFYAQLVTILWSPWKHRNAVIFSATQPSPNVLSGSPDGILLLHVCRSLETQWFGMAFLLPDRFGFTTVSCRTLGCHTKFHAQMQTLREVLLWIVEKRLHSVILLSPKKKWMQILNNSLPIPWQIQPVASDIHVLKCQVPSLVWNKGSHPLQRHIAQMAIRASRFFTSQSWP
ncbi:hypothetical protein PTKIN_Ptkin18bG0143400 [Pterospermum kingtungense]